MIEIVLNNKIYNVIIKIKKIKNLYIRIDDELNILVSCNKYYTTKKIVEFIYQNQEKIINMYELKLRKQERGKHFYFLGQPYDLQLSKEIKKYEINKEKQLIYIRSKASFLKLVEDTYKDYINQIIPSIKEEIPPFKLKIRNMKSKWGVCNRKDNTITLSLNLIGCSEEFIKYVIIHEICHFSVFNHSKDFYNLVKKYMPNYKEIVKQNKEW